MHVLEHEDERSGCGAALQIPPQTERELLAQLVWVDLGERLFGSLDPGEHAYALRDGVRVLPVITEGLARGATDLFDRDLARLRDADTRIGTDDELYRVIRDPLAIRQAAAGANAIVADRVEELGRES